MYDEASKLPLVSMVLVDALTDYPKEDLILRLVHNMT